MCGIFGHTGYAPEIHQRSQDALNTLVHRGPDQWGEFYDDNVYTGHRRLSILDVSENARQPFVSPCGIVATVNGEIYNFPELKSELKSNYEFKSDSDSEIIPAGYRVWGLSSLLEKLNGMFAFSVYDQKKQKIFLVRDRIGIKPLYYAYIDNRLIWASEMKAIVAFLSNKVPEYEYSALYDFLTYNYIPAPKTLYKGIHKLLPGHYLDYDVLSSRISLKRYWQPVYKPEHISEKSASETLRHLLGESVRKQMASDVPLGFFLSGGVDSSAVVRSATVYESKVHTFSIGFHEKDYDESVDAALVARFLNTDHNEAFADISGFRHLMPRMVSWYDEPFADSSAIPTYLVSENARQKVKVVLTGDGGDEVFGGYVWYRIFNQYRRYGLHRSLQVFRKFVNEKNLFETGNTFLKKFFHVSMLNDYELLVKLIGGMADYEKREYATLWNIPKDYDSYWYFRKHDDASLPLRTRLQMIDMQTYLPDDILTKVDRVSMAVSLEARVPLLSEDIINFSLSLPENIRYLNGELKGLFKEALKGLLPERTLEKQKWGFGVPMKHWDLFPGSDYRFFSEMILHKYFINS